LRLYESIVVASVVARLSASEVAALLRCSSNVCLSTGSDAQVEGATDQARTSSVPYLPARLHPTCDHPNHDIWMPAYSSLTSLYSLCIAIIAVAHRRLCSIPDRSVIVLPSDIYFSSVPVRAYRVRWLRSLMSQIFYP
jgi:hypothetical protein